MAKRPCARPGCPELVVKGYCAGHQASSPKALSDVRRGSSTERGYGYRWQKYSAGRLRRYPVCEGLRLAADGPVVVNTHAGIVRAAKLTDHIVPHRGDQALLWDPRNHQSGCKDCHDVKTAKYDGGFGKASGISGMG